jgi:hypothetical protein
LDCEVSQEAEGYSKGSPEATFSSAAITFARSSTFLKSGTSIVVLTKEYNIKTVTTAGRFNNNTSSSGCGERYGFLTQNVILLFYFLQKHGFCLTTEVCLRQRIYLLLFVFFFLVFVGNTFESRKKRFMRRPGKIIFFIVLHLCMYKIIPESYIVY